MRGRVFSSSKERRGANVRSSTDGLSTARSPAHSWRRQQQTNGLRFKRSMFGCRRPPPHPPCPLQSPVASAASRDKAVSRGGQRGEDYCRYTPDKSVRSIIGGDSSSSWRRPHVRVKKKKSVWFAIMEIK